MLDCFGCALHIKRKGRHSLCLLHQHFNLLASFYQFLQVLVDNLIDFLSLFTQSGNIINLVRRVVELHVVFENRRKLRTTIHGCPFDLLSRKASIKQFFDFFEVAESDSLRVLVIAHDHVDLVDVKHIKDVVVSRVLDVLAVGRAHLYYLLCCQHEVATEWSILHQQHVSSRNHCVYYRHIIISCTTQKDRICRSWFLTDEFLNI